MQYTKMKMVTGQKGKLPGLHFLFPPPIDEVSSIEDIFLILGGENMKDNEKNKKVLEIAVLVLKLITALISLINTLIK